MITCVLNYIIDNVVEVNFNVKTCSVAVLLCRLLANLLRKKELLQRLSRGGGSEAWECEMSTDTDPQNVQNFMHLYIIIIFS